MPNITKFMLISCQLFILDDYQHDQHEKVILRIDMRIMTKVPNIQDQQKMKQDKIYTNSYYESLEGKQTKAYR